MSVRHGHVRTQPGTVFRDGALLAMTGDPCQAGAERLPAHHDWPLPGGVQGEEMTCQGVAELSGPGLNIRHSSYLNSIVDDGFLEGFFKQSGVRRKAKSIQ